MKPTGRHPTKKLSPATVRATNEPGRYADGNGLYLIVDPSGAKRWVLRTMVHGRRRDIGLGGVQTVTLAEAREQATEMRRIARAGGDPLGDRRKARQAVPTFEQAARQVYKERRATWRNAKHASQWINTLEAYVFPMIGGRQVNQLDTPDILRVLGPVWLTKPETARRVRQRIATVFDWARASGFREGENPVAGVDRGLPRQPEDRTHHTALPVSELPGFITRLRESDANEITRLAFEFLILTATRTSEVLCGKWTEIDLEAGIWAIPAARMKMKREHRVPLYDRCREILARAREIGCGSDYIFPGRNIRKPLSNMAFLMALRRMELDVTAHGFRSTFADWAAERTRYPREVVEMALAHVVKNKTEAAYRRGDLLDKRRQLMEDWQRFALGSIGQVVTLNRA
jgi:integrase